MYIVMTIVLSHTNSEHWMSGCDTYVVAAAENGCISVHGGNYSAAGSATVAHKAK